VSAQNQFLFWSAITALLIAFVVIFQDVLAPFILGTAIAYLLNPLVNRLGDLGLSRRVAALTILLVFFALLVGILVVVTPVLYRELLGLARDIPSYLDNALTLAKPYSDRFAEFVSANSEREEIKQILGKSLEPTMNIARAALDYIGSGGQAVGSFFATLIIMPIVAYFMMKEWNRIADWVTGLFPRDKKDTMMELLKEIDKKISGFVRGQILVALVLACIYSVALTLAGLKYGFLIGIVSGLLSIIPMVGSVTGFVVSVAMAWFQTGELSFVLMIGGIFIVGQIVEGNFLTPKLVGESVGLHPLWVFFALLAGGAVMGLTGMFLAVPIVAVTGVLIAYGIERYKASPLYKGRKTAAPQKKQAKPKKTKAKQ